MFAVVLRRTILAASAAVSTGGAVYFFQKSLSGKVENEKPSPMWHPPTRQALVNRLMGLTDDGKQQKAIENTEYDLLIIGAGATGAGCTLDAAARGMKVACVERDDISSGTSSRSTKLIHGGVRYLEKAIKTLDYGQLALVTEALRERKTFLKIAPYLAHELPIMLPIYKWYQVPYFWIGSKMYDILSGRRALESSYFMPKGKVVEEFPMLNKANLAGAMVYYDGQQNDSRMNVVLATTAINMGADLVNYVEVVGLTKDKANGKLNGAIVRDRMTGKQFPIKAKGIINATGPYCDSIRFLDDPTEPKMVAPSLGTHIVLPDYYSPRNMGLLDPATSDGRVIFFLPWEGVTIAGTTDTPTETTFSPMPTEHEIDFILREISHYLGEGFNVRRSDVLAAWSGIRPLITDPSKASTQSLVRSHLIHISKSGLLTISGGKWTTYRNMAQETIDRAVQEFGLKPKKESNTENILLIGSHNYSPNLYLKLIQQYGFEIDVAKHLAESYGDRAFTVAEIAEEGPTHRWPFFGKRLVPYYPYIEAEVRYAVKHELAVTVIDVLARRTRLAFIDCIAAYDAIPRVTEIMAGELRWSTDRCKAEKASAIEYLRTMGYGMISPNLSQFSKSELIKYRKEFHALDADDDGSIGIDDMKVLMGRIGLTIDDNSIEKMISEVDINKNGTIEFTEFLECITKLKDDQSDNPKFIQFLHDVEAASVERSGGGL